MNRLETSVKVTVSPTFGLEFDIVKSAVGAKVVVPTVTTFTCCVVVLVLSVRVSYC